jgi:hypothetical protein
VTDRKTDERNPKWFDKWVNPTTVLAILGGIVWGVQLNSNIELLDGRTLRTKATSIANREAIGRADMTDAKTVYVLDNLVTRVTATEAELKRIVRNEYGHSGPP